MKFTAPVIALLAFAGSFVSAVSSDSTDNLEFRQYYNTVVGDILASRYLYDPDLLSPRDYSEDMDDLVARYDLPPPPDPDQPIPIQFNFTGMYDNGARVFFHSTLAVTFKESNFSLEVVQGAVLPKANDLMQSVGKPADITWSRLTIFCPDGSDLHCDENSTILTWLDMHQVSIAMTGPDPPIPPKKEPSLWQKFKDWWGHL